jgi:glycosyltransferase involved in cell wall biosynthesis
MIHNLPNQKKYWVKSSEENRFRGVGVREYIVQKDKWAAKSSIKLVSIIVPIFNEAQTLKKTLESINATMSEGNYPFEIIVVESNSPDGSGDIARRVVDSLNVSKPETAKLIVQNVAKGKGSAVREGLKVIRGDVVAIYDADDEYRSNDLLKLVEKLSEGNSSFILGTRHSKGSAMRVMNGHPILSRLMNFAHWFFTAIFNVTFNVKLTDPFTMHKVFYSRIFENIELIADRFDIDWEILGKAIKLGAIPLEIPVYYQARSYKEGKKVRIFLDPAKWMIILFKVKFGRLRDESL